MDRMPSLQSLLTTFSQTTVPLQTTPQAPSIAISTSDSESASSDLGRSYLGSSSSSSESENYWSDSSSQEENGELRFSGYLRLDPPHAEFDLWQQLKEIINTLSGDAPVGVCKEYAEFFAEQLLRAYYQVCGMDQGHEIVSATREVMCSEGASKLCKIDRLQNYVLFGCLYAECAVLNSEDMAVKMRGLARRALWMEAYKEGARMMIELALQAQEAWGGDTEILRNCFFQWLKELPKASECPKICLKSIPALQGLINALAACVLKHKQAFAELKGYDEKERMRIDLVLVSMLPSLAIMHDAEDVNHLLNQVIEQMNAFFIHTEELVKLELAPRSIAMSMTASLCWIVGQRSKAYENLEFPVHLTKLLLDVVQPCHDELARFVAKCDQLPFLSFLNHVLGTYGMDPSKSNPDAIREVLVQLFWLDRTGYFFPNSIIALFNRMFNEDRRNNLKKILKEDSKFDFCEYVQYGLQRFNKICRSAIKKYKDEMIPHLIVPEDLGSQIMKLVNNNSRIFAGGYNNYFLSELKLNLNKELDAIKKMCVQFECLLIEAAEIHDWVERDLRSRNGDSSMKEQIIQEELIDYQRRNCIFKEWAENLILEPEELRVLIIKWRSGIDWMTFHFERTRDISRLDRELCVALLNVVYLLNHQFGCSPGKVEEHLFRLVSPILFRIPIPNPADFCTSIAFWLNPRRFKSDENRSSEAESSVTRSGREDIELLKEIVDFLSQEKGEAAQLLKVAFSECPPQVEWILNITAFETRKNNLSVEEEFAEWEAEVRARINCILRIYHITEGSFIECIDLAREVMNEMERARKAISETDTTAEGTSNRVIENLETILADKEVEFPRNVAALEFLLLKTGYCTLPCKEWRLAIQEFVKFVKKIELGVFRIDAAYSGMIESYLRHVVTIMPVDGIRAFGNDEIETCFDGFLSTNASFRRQYQYGKLLNIKIKEAVAKKSPSEATQHEGLHQCPYLFDERIVERLLPLLESESQEDHEKANQVLERIGAIHAADPDQRSLMLSVDFLLHFLNHFEELQSCLSTIGCEAIRTFEAYVQPVEGQVRALSSMAFFIVVEKQLKFTDAEQRRFIVEGIRKTARLKERKPLQEEVRSSLF